MECNLGWNHMHDFKIKWVRSVSLLEITSKISDKNCMTWGSTTLLHPFWNHPNTGLDTFKYFIDAVLSWSEIKFIHFLEGKSKSFGNKSCKICHMILFVGAPCFCYCRYLFHYSSQFVFASSPRLLFLLFTSYQIWGILDRLVQYIWLNQLSLLHKSEAYLSS